MFLRSAEYHYIACSESLPIVITRLGSLAIHSSIMTHAASLATDSPPEAKPTKTLHHVSSHWFHTLPILIIFRLSMPRASLFVPQCTNDTETVYTMAYVNNASLALGGHDPRSTDLIEEQESKSLPWSIPPCVSTSS